MTRRNRIVAFGALALIVFVASLAIVFDPVSQETATPLTIEAIARGAANPELDQHVDERARVAQPAVAEATVASATARSVTGKVYVRELDGRQQLARDGSLQLEVWRDGIMQPRVRSESVEEGAWSTTVGTNTKLVTSTYTAAGGRFGRAQRLEITSTDEGAACDVLVDWEKGITLRCLDAATSRELTGVEVRVVPAATENLQFHPPEPPARDADRQQRVFVGDSPVHLPCFALPMRGWARAPGTTWRSFSFSGCTGERVLHIEAGGELEVVVADPHLLPHPAWISVWDCTGARAQRVGHAKLGGTDGARFDALPARELVVCLTDNPETCGRVLDVATVSLVAGGTAVVDVCAGCAASRSRTGAITLEIAAATESIRSIAAESVDARRPQLAAQRPERSDQADEPYPPVLELGRFVPGRHRIDLAPAIASVEIDVVPGGEHRITSLARATRRLGVTVVDRESGSVLEHASVNARLRAGTTAGPWVVGAFDREEQVHVVTLGGGDVALAVSLDGYESEGLTVVDADVAAGVRIELARGSRYPVRIHLEEAGSGVGFSSDAWDSARITPIPPCDGRVLRRTFGTAGDGIDARPYMEWQVNRPGRYEITWPRFDGYAALEKHEIGVTSTDTAPIVVQLVSAR